MSPRLTEDAPLNLRERVKSTRDKKSREIFVGLADKYEQMAQILDEIVTSDRKLRDRNSK
jgi:hypothetical protein